MGVKNRPRITVETKKTTYQVETTPEATETLVDLPTDGEWLENKLAQVLTEREELRQEMGVLEVELVNLRHKRQREYGDWLYPLLDKVDNLKEAQTADPEELRDLAQRINDDERKWKFNQIADLAENPDLENLLREAEQQFQEKKDEESEIDRRVYNLDGSLSELRRKDNNLVSEEKDLRNQLRVLKRNDHIGEVIKLSEQHQDPNSIHNIFALDPHFGFSRSRKNHPEQMKWNYGCVHKSGTVVKTRTLKEMEKLTNLLDSVSPLMKDLGIELPMLYSSKQITTHGECQTLTKMDSFFGGAGKRTPKIIRLSPSGEIYTLIHELAHLPEDHYPRKRAGQKNYDYQKSIHDDYFKKRFANYLDYYLRSYASEDDVRGIAERIKDDTYAPPAFDPRRDDPNYHGIVVRDEINGTGRVVYSEKKSNSLGDGWTTTEVPVEELFK